MTRINITTRLSDELLVNALGEEPRVLTAVVNRIEKGKHFKDIPKEFTLGTGHMKFFYNKCLYIWNRYTDLRFEYGKRFLKHYSLDHLESVVNKVDYIENNTPHLFNNWTPSEGDIQLVKQRILERSKGYTRTHHYYGEPIKDWKTFLEI